jgi:hypothetical protein
MFQLADQKPRNLRSQTATCGAPVTDEREKTGQAGVLMLRIGDILYISTAHDG